MRNREPLSPDSSGEYSFLNPNFLEDLLVTELDIDAQNMLELLAYQLNRAYDQEIRGNIFFLANGHMVSGQKNRVSTHKRTFYGALKGFEVLKTKLGQSSICALLRDDDDNSRLLLVSAQDGREPTLLPDYPRSYNSQPKNKWLQISQEFPLDLTRFLQEVAVELPKEGPYTAVLADELDQIEEVLNYEYGLWPNDLMTVAGMNAYRGEGKNPIPNEAQNGIEGGNSGRFLGLTFHDLMIKPDVIVTRLCIALEVEENVVALQPCYALESVHLESS